MSIPSPAITKERSKTSLSFMFYLGKVIVYFAFSYIRCGEEEEEGKHGWKPPVHLLSSLSPGLNHPCWNLEQPNGHFLVPAGITPKDCFPGSGLSENTLLWPCPFLPWPCPRTSLTWGERKKDQMAQDFPALSWQGIPFCHRNIKMAFKSPLCCYRNGRTQGLDKGSDQMNQFLQ